MINELLKKGEALSLDNPPPGNLYNNTRMRAKNSAESMK